MLNIKTILNNTHWENCYTTNCLFHVNKHVDKKDYTYKLNINYLLENPYNKKSPIGAIIPILKSNYSKKLFEHQLAKTLGIKFIFSAQRGMFNEYNTITKSHKLINPTQFPSPEDMYKVKQASYMYNQAMSIPYYHKKNGKKPRYYQKNGISNVFHAMSMGQRKIMLAMATGSGKTYTAFQIAYKLIKLREKEHKTTRILYIVDRNDLITQPMNKDFKPLVKSKNGLVTTLNGKQLPKLPLFGYKFGIFFENYQTFFGNQKKRPYRALPCNTFNLIICDEAHRGADKHDGSWRNVLNYFAPRGSKTIVLGMTATPRTTYNANLGYYGLPVYRYTLKQGIQDGFLASYYLQEYHPRMNADYDSPKRNQYVVSHFMNQEKKLGLHTKAVIFCDTIAHAHRIEHLILNQYHYNSVDCLTGDGKYRFNSDAIKKFCQDKSEPYIATSSELLRTGVDIPSLKVIVLACHIDSLIELEQIIGRGTRKNKTTHKNHFLIMDFGNNQRILEHYKGISENIIGKIRHNPSEDELLKPTDLM